MAATDIQSTGVFMPSAVGGNVYVWSPAGRPPSETGRTGCVITAHGRQALVSSFYRSRLSKRVTMHFYCPNGYNLVDPDLLPIVTGRIAASDRCTSASARQDYVISKCQGKHNPTGKETYKLIQQDLHPGFLIEQTTSHYVKEKATWDRVFESNPSAHEKQLEKMERDELGLLGNIREVCYDVVTLRHRRGRADMTLFQLVAQLHAAGFHYTDIHCSFCRGPALGEGLGSWVPGRGKRGK